jgi:hypothetical protein
MFVRVRNEFCIPFPMWCGALVMVSLIEEGRAASKSSLKIWLFSFYAPAADKLVPHKFKNSRFLISNDFSLPNCMYMLNSLKSSLTVYILRCLSACWRDCRDWNRNCKKVQPWEQANIRQKLDLVWRNRRKLAKLSKTTFTYRSSF